MVLFDEDPVSLITETTNQFHIAPDKDALARISSSLSALAFNRSSRIEAEHATMKSLSRKLNTLKSQSEYDQARRNTSRHASEILAMDGEKFRIAKTVNEIEVDGERLSGEIATLKGSLEELKRKGSDNRKDEGDATILRLQVYRSMGVDLTTDQAIVRSNGAMKVVPLGANSTSANHIWSAMQ